jgi:hypothetical protein
MSLEHSRKLIHNIAATREADDYFEGLLKEPEMRVMAEASEIASKWDTVTNDTGTLTPATSQQEMEMER